MVDQLSGVRALAGVYQAILIDQFGVLHDGKTALPGAREAVLGLRDQGARLAVISNSGKRAAVNQERLRALGFEEALFDGVMTSGELARQFFTDWLREGRLEGGTGVHFVSADDDRAVIAGLPLTEVERAADSGLLLIAGAGASTTDNPEIETALRAHADQGTPCVCINPDVRMYVDGCIVPGPGAVAERYAELGGRVIWIGKPDPSIFQAARETLGVPAEARTLVIGDSPYHDVAGAQRAGYDWLFVSGGIYADETAPAALEADLGKSRGYAIERLVW
ncbi:TIGR01459 family HAD-type hydrolase [Rhodovibrio salinarum]|uniref:TIGR01459 family HAD-type hydrolase n=1 Tax=Rhodovibrio salinarum TaxID=1087 RepID=UPI0004B9BE23|nr:TIGR01459 family HAD-type hydrolase [Rhodovibrio salinarum]